MQPQDGVEQWLTTNWALRPETFGVEVEGAQIACRGWNLSATELPGIVLVHGFRAHARWWDHIAPSLTDYHRVVALDMSGMGDSDWRQEYSRAQYAREILAVVEHAGFAPVTVIAHSFGAIGAIMAARAAPEKIARLVVIDSGLPLPTDEKQIMQPPARFYPDAEAGAARFRLIPPGEWPQPSVLAYVARHALRETAEGWTWKFDPEAAASLNRESYREAMFGVTVPVDVVFGDRSEIMPPPRRALLRDIAANTGREVAIPASHHHVLIEQPIALVSALLGLLANPRG